MELALRGYLRLEMYETDVSVSDFANPSQSSLRAQRTMSNRDFCARKAVQSCPVDMAQPPKPTGHPLVALLMQIHARSPAERIAEVWTSSTLDIVRASDADIGYTSQRR